MAFTDVENSALGEKFMTSTVDVLSLYTLLATQVKVLSRCKTENIIKGQVS